MGSWIKAIVITGGIFAVRFYGEYMYMKGFKEAAEGEEDVRCDFD